MKARRRLEVQGHQFGGLFGGAFGRAMNRIYEIGEGRPVWKLRPAMLLLTAVLVVLVAVALAGLVVSGPVTGAIGDKLGVGGTAQLVFSIVKWPLIVLLVVGIVALLYYFTPNVRQPKFRWVSVGAVLAIVVWALASAAFGFYVANFSSYNKTYGTELDAELERGRELASGIAAEEEIQLPPRDDRNIEKAEAKARDDVEKGRELRHRANRDDS